MDSSQSDRGFRCPECGMLLAVGADRCWKCGREFPTTADRPPVSGDLPPFNCGKGDDLPPFRNDLITLLKILGSLVIIVVAACIAFFVTCFGGFFAGANLASRGEDSLGLGLFLGIGGGLIAASIVTTLLARLFLSRKRKKRGQEHNPEER